MPGSFPESRAWKVIVRIADNLMLLQDCFFTFYTTFSPHMVIKGMIVVDTAVMGHACYLLISHKKNTGLENPVLSVKAESSAEISYWNSQSLAGARGTSQRRRANKGTIYKDMGAVCGSTRADRAPGGS